MRKNYLSNVACVATAILILSSSGCKKNDLVKSNGAKEDIGKLSTNFVTPVSFNWETVDWMPTPPGQSQIPPPWIGQGSISSVYSADVVNDHRAADGWQLVYNTFSATAPGSLVNPYFMLYNPYRGLLRIFLYTTTQFISPSTYLVDGLSVVGSKSTSMLNFLGTDIVRYTNQTGFSQIEPAPLDGSQPLASNRWYMLQYEIAYDPLIETYNYDDIQLSWFTNYNSVSSLSLGGTATGTIKTSAAAQASALTAALKAGGKVAGTAAISALGVDLIKNNGDATTGTNTLGLSKDVYKAALSGVTKTLSAAAGGIPGAIVGILSAVIGGSSSSSTMSFDLNSTITLSGTLTTSGSFPSSPTSVYVPGTKITSAAQNYVPLYTSTMGVFNLTGVPTFNVKYTPGQDSNTNIALTADEINGTNLVFNKAVTDIAKIQNIHEEVVLIDEDKIYQWLFNSQSQSYYGFSGATGVKQTVGDHTIYSGSPSIDAVTEGVTFTDENGIYTEYNGAEVNNGLGIRVSFDVVPNNGAPKSTIIKTFAMGPYYLSVHEL